VRYGACSDGDSVQEATVGRAASREDIAEALCEVVRRVASGEPVSSVDVAAAASMQQQAQAPVSDSVTSIM